MTVVYCLLLDRLKACQRTVKLTQYLRGLEQSAVSERGEGVKALATCTLNYLRRLPSAWLCFSGCPYSRLGDFTGGREKEMPIFSLSEPSYHSDIERII